MNGDKALRRTTIAAVTIVAVVAGWVSYRHALAVVSAHGETGWVSRAYPLTIDGMIYAASMVLLNAARHRTPAPRLAYLALGLGISATVAVNVTAGLAFGPVGALVAAWPAPALVISYELLMVVVRSSVQHCEQPAGAHRTRNGYPGTQADRAQRPGIRQRNSSLPTCPWRVPSIRRIREQMHVGQPRVQEIREYLAERART